MGFIDIIINKIVEGKSVNELAYYLVPKRDGQSATAGGAGAAFYHINTSGKYQILISCALTNDARDGRWVFYYYPDGDTSSSQLSVISTEYQGAVNDTADPFAPLKEPLVLAPLAGVGFINTNSAALDNIAMYLFYLEVDL